MKPTLEILPTQEEVERWMLDTLRHATMVEYYTHALGIHNHDSQRPHDLNGEGNKFEWAVLKHLALQYRFAQDSLDFEKYVRPGIIRHQECQYHHKVWHNPQQGFPEVDLKISAIDALCSMMDPSRKYSGGILPFEAILERIHQDAEHRKHFGSVYHRMNHTPDPDLDEIISIKEFPNVGLPHFRYRQIQHHTAQTIKFLNEEKGYTL